MLWRHGAPMVIPIYSTRRGAIGRPSEVFFFFANVGFVSSLVAFLDHVLLRWRRGRAVSYKRLIMHILLKLVHATGSKRNYTIGKALRTDTLIIFRDNCFILTVLNLALRETTVTRERNFTGRRKQVFVVLSLRRKEGKTLYTDGRWWVT